VSEADDSRFEEERSSDPVISILRDPIGVLVRRWKPMLAGFLAVASAVGVVAALLAPLYLASATVSVLGARISENFVQTTVEIGTLDQINAIVSELLSRKNLEQIVLEHELAEEGLSADELDDVVQVVRKRVEIEADQESIVRQQGRQASVVYAISFRDADPDRAAAVANALASSFIDVHLRLRSSEARVTTEFLRRELTEVEAELREQERLATQFKQRYRGELPGELDTNLARLERLQETRRVLVDQLRALEGAPVADEQVLPDGSPEARLLGLRRRLDEAMAVYTPDHPNVIALQRQVEAMERELGMEPLAGVRGASASARDAKALRRRIAEVERELSELDSRLARTPERQEEQEALDRRLEVLRENYSELLRKVDQAELSESVESAQHGVRVSILDRAVAPSEREKSRAKVLIAGLVCALGIAGLIAVVLEHFDAVVIDGDQLEALYGLPVIGNAPHIS
jgi:uncharacterized protein involved in exopolysaccharide biosynthesis